nr:MAG TPA: hypothetical protein [Caudoviricetes sp.]
MSIISAFSASVRRYLYIPSINVLIRSNNRKIVITIQSSCKTINLWFIISIHSSNR